MGDLQTLPIAKELDIIPVDGAALALAGIFPAGIDEGADIGRGRRASHWH